MNERKDYIKNKYNLCIHPKVRSAFVQAESVVEMLNNLCQSIRHTMNKIKDCTKEPCSFIVKIFYLQLNYHIFLDQNIILFNHLGHCVS